MGDVKPPTSFAEDFNRTESVLAEMAHLEPGDPRLEAFTDAFVFATDNGAVFRKYQFSAPGIASVMRMHNVNTRWSFIDAIGQMDPNDLSPTVFTPDNLLWAYSFYLGGELRLREELVAKLGRIAQSFSDAKSQAQAIARMTEIGLFSYDFLSSLNDIVSLIDLPETREMGIAIFKAAVHIEFGNPLERGNPPDILQLLVLREFYEIAKEGVDEWIGSLHRALETASASADAGNRLNIFVSEILRSQDASLQNMSLGAVLDDAAAAASFQMSLRSFLVLLKSGFFGLVLMSGPYASGPVYRTARRKIDEEMSGNVVTLRHAALQVGAALASRGQLNGMRLAILDQVVDFIYGTEDVWSEAAAAGDSAERLQLLEGMDIVSELLLMLSIDPEEIVWIDRAEMEGLNLGGYFSEYEKRQQDGRRTATYALYHEAVESLGKVGFKVAQLFDEETDEESEDEEPGNPSGAAPAPQGTPPVTPSTSGSTASSSGLEHHSTVMGLVETGETSGSSYDYSIARPNANRYHRVQQRYGSTQLRSAQVAVRMPAVLARPAAAQIPIL